MDKSGVSPEVAKEQLDKYLEYFDLDIEEIKDEQTNDIVRSAIELSYSRWLKGMVKGKIEITFDDDSAQIIQHVGRGESTATLTYKELTGAAKVAMKEGSSEYGRMYALAGNLTGVGFAGIQKLKGGDLSLVECIALLLLQI